MTIWKFALKVEDRTVIPMPEGAQILCVQTQGETPQIWAVVNVTAPLKPRVLLVRGTGHQMREAEGCPYIGTFQIMGGALVFHVFDGGTA